MPLADLIAREEDSAGRAPAADDLRVEAALALVNRKLLPHDFSKAFGWSVDHARETLENLCERRAGTALKIHCTGGRYWIAPLRAALTNRELQTLKRAAVTRTRISSSDAALLKTAIDHRATGWAGDTTEAQRPALAHLINLGWLEHRNGRFYPTPEVTFSLGLSSREQPPHRASNASKATKARRARPHLPQAA